MYPPDKYDPEERDSGCTRGYLAVRVSYPSWYILTQAHDAITGRPKYLHKSEVCEKAGGLGAN
jgi:hypothetical protein